MNEFYCLDCGIDTSIIDHYYMLSDELWRSVNPGNDGMLCLWCLESRLNRPLCWDDFPDLPINTDYGFGEAFDQFVTIGELSDEEKNIFRQKIFHLCLEFMDSRDKGNDKAEMGETIPGCVAQ